MNPDTSNESVRKACAPNNAAVLQLNYLAMPHSFMHHQLPAMYEREAIQVAIESNQVIQWPEQNSIYSCQCATDIDSKITYFLQIVELST